MQSPPISQAEIDARLGDHLDELLELWQAEQGATKPRDLDLMASVIPHAHGDAVRVLDLCCGPGDAGRAIARRYPAAQIDGIDRDPFLTAMCRGLNRREDIPGTVAVRDLNDAGWANALAAGYDVVVVVNALHWFSPARAAQLTNEAYTAMRDGGMFLLAEPVSAETPFAAGFEAWKATQPPRYSQENWLRFWERANAILGYDHIALLGPRDDTRVDDKMGVEGWLGLTRAAGFERADVLLRDADQVIVAALKSS